MKKMVTALTMALVVLFSSNPISATSKPATFGIEKMSPDFSASDVSVDSSITISFTRNIKQGEGKVILVDGYQQPVAASIQISGNSIDIVPSAPLKYRSTYIVAIDKDAVKNAEEDTNLYLNDKFTYSFTTPNISDAEIAKRNATVSQPVTLQLAPETALQPAQTYTVKKEAPVTYKINATNGNYKLWTANPQLVSLQVQGDNLTIKGLNAGTTQVAVKNLVNNTKVVLNVVVQ